MGRFLRLIMWLILCVVCLQAQDTGWVKLVATVRPAIVVITTENGQGTGFFVRPNGILATNQHVIRGAQGIRVTLHSGETFERASVLAEDETKDLAILKIDAVDMTSLPLGNSNDVEVGEEVLLVGTPSGLEETFSNGIVSSVRILGNGVRVIQTNAPASPGSSGGPLISRSGEAIGVLAYGWPEGENLNFAVAVNYLRGLLDNANLVPPLSPLRTMTRLGVRVPPDTRPLPKPTDSVLFFAHRTEKHITYSSADVFQRAVDGLMLFLKSKGIALANDMVNQPMQTEMPISVDEVVGLNRNYVGASHILFLTVDRPISSWIKLTMQCLDRDGKMLWQEEAKPSWVSLNPNIQPTIESLKKKIQDRIAKTPLPLVGRKDRAPH
jgi:hypothetical protein